MGRSVRISEEAGRALDEHLERYGADRNSPLGRAGGEVRIALARLDRIPKSKPKTSKASPELLRALESLNPSSESPDASRKKWGGRSRKPSKAEKRDATAAIRDACLERAGGLCECGCRRILHPDDLGSWSADSIPQLDHFFSRRHGQSVETCWILRADCHLSKTRNEPDAASWLRKFIIHARNHDRQNPSGLYGRALILAQRRLAFVEVRASLPAAPKVKP